jgi:hypothetical protein
MIPEEWREEYLKKSGDNEIKRNNLTVNDHGFSNYLVGDNYILIMQVYGDGKYWDNFFIEKAKELGKKELMFATKRNIGGFIRKFGYKKLAVLLHKEV